MLRAYDLLIDNGEDLRPLPFRERRKRLERFVVSLANDRVDLSPLVAFTTWDDLAAARKNPTGAGADADAVEVVVLKRRDRLVLWYQRHRPERLDLSPTIPFRGWDDLAAARKNPATAGAGDDADAVEGVMLKRRDAAYVPGRPKGPWWKWKPEPFVVDAVLMYAQRGHGKRSSFYSDYTFGVWRDGAEGDELVPVGKAYFGFSDEELRQLDNWVRDNTVERFGPVREVRRGLVFEVAFDSIHPSSRHKSGLAMRFPRIARIRWDKPVAEADRLDSLLELAT